MPANKLLQPPVVFPAEFTGNFTHAMAVLEPVILIRPVGVVGIVST